jgi:hypothetical protein
MLYVDEHDRQGTQTTLADLVASTLTTGHQADQTDVKGGA